MLERASGCLENAGRRVLRNSHGAVRSGYPLCDRSRKERGAGVDAPHWLLALLQASGQQSSSAADACHGNKSGRAGGGPRPLEFLYPREPQRLVAPRPSHPQRRPGLRRRRSLVGLSRSYVSVSSLRQAVADVSLGHEHASQGTEGQEAKDSCIQDPVTEDQQVEDPEIEDLAPGGLGPRDPENGNQTTEKPQDPESIERERNLQARLHEFLQKDTHLFDTAWIRFVAAGRPSNLVSPLCAYMSKSKTFKDKRRAWYLFQLIPHEKRTAYDYRNILASDLQLSHVDKPRHLDNICTHVLSTPFAQEIISLVVKHYVEQREWGRLRFLWSKLIAIPLSKRGSLCYDVLQHINRTSFPEFSFARHLLDLAPYAMRHIDDETTYDFTRRLLQRFAESKDILEFTPPSSILAVLRAYGSTGLLHHRAYIKLINHHLFGDRDQFIRGILFYRQFRSDMPDVKPPKPMLVQVLERLQELRIPEAVDYFLDELQSRTRQPPSIYVLVRALNTFAMSSDVKNVHRIYNLLIELHGLPRSRKIVAPVLLVHARLGDVPGTLRQFERIAAEFDLTPSTTCWNMLILAHANAGDLQGALSTFSDLLESGQPPDTYSFGPLLTLFSKRGDVANVRRLIKEAQLRGVKMNTSLLDKAVRAYCSNGELRFAEELIEASVNLVEGSTLRMWNILLMHYARRISKYSFRRILDRIGKLGLVPDAWTHAAIMLAYSLSNQPDFARNSLRTMHRSGLRATQHHYSILLLGYLRRRNRDMVHVIFREIETRFGRPGLSASLLNLQMQIRRDLENVHDKNTPAENIVLEQAEKTLMKSIENFSANPAAATHASPMTTEGSSVDLATTMHYQHLVTSYAVEGSTEKAFDMLNQYISHRKLSGIQGNDLESLPLGFVKAIMILNQKTQRFDKVEDCWHVLMGKVHKLAGNVSLDEFFSASTSESSLAAPVDSESGAKGSILSSRRYMLDFPFTLFMRSLACREQFDRIHDEVAKFQQAGFSMSGMNWSNYVASLASSDNTKDIVAAFQLFEEKFFPHFPGWSWMKQGYGIRPLHCPVTIHHLDGQFGMNKPRRMMGRHAINHWRRLDPGYMHPDYPTMVLLAAAIRRLRDASIEEGPERMKTLHATATNTFEIIANMPYLPDKYQGALLRDREVFPDALSFPVKIFTTRTGALGVERGPTTRTFARATEEPLDLDMHINRNPVDEQNVTRLLPDAERESLGALATVIPREDRIAIEQQFYEYSELTRIWKKRSAHQQGIIQKAKLENKGLMYGIPVEFVLNKYKPKKLALEQQLFNKYHRRWRHKKPTYLLYKPVSGYREQRNYRAYSAQGLSQRGMGRKRKKRREFPTMTREEASVIGRGRVTRAIEARKAAKAAQLAQAAKAEEFITSSEV
ncbi:unnamed protein product [Penicillium salamii]|uniref:Uncharacterized protein n=1 Tax=Penicillium salamii TaxID=1612424 RepID=A0A9W4IR98_9EURO|nr:unnamed protein product [Penicillium salamii]CAG8044464.1 unnamed protein product [Penicillium salamii]CAG8338673.1 unnamed protein product [Penicillium salamii]CAG8345996.1 unnamed protein product [Penicillium salamii]CAG8346016.1 unnamed protein product [Penicillium salamii]